MRTLVGRHWFGVLPRPAMVAARVFQSLSLSLPLSHSRSLSRSLSLCLSVCLCLSLCLSVCLSLSLSLSLSLCLRPFLCSDRFADDARTAKRRTILACEDRMYTMGKQAATPQVRRCLSLALSLPFVVRSLPFVVRSLPFLGLWLPFLGLWLPFLGLWPPFVVYPLPFTGLRPTFTHCLCLPPQSCYEVWGFDLMLDDQLTPWVIEVNTSPSLCIFSCASLMHPI